ncbi:HCL338Wp [Eremothecium sinecaudum]|uniref:HCL338Wp n=1 Tax=Eremothecium sinecaudum TaxID=45286 RepID=A0A109UYE5_9SACH|nr:HCL338Wp [Eremothecium sinecaudum]AMD19813.1 HCL338Wp [Eremothecium sinecaudum]
MSTFNIAIKLSNKTAIIVPETNEKISYNDLSNIVGHLQTMFLDVQCPLSSQPRNGAVAFCLPNGLEMVSVFLSVAMDGMVSAPLNPSYKCDEFHMYLDDLKTNVIFVSKGMASNSSSEIIKCASSRSAFVVEVFYEPRRGRVEYEVFSPMNKYTSSVFSSLKSRGLFVNNEDKFPGRATEYDTALILHSSGTTAKPKVIPLSHRNITTNMRNISKTYKLSPKDTTYIVMPLFHVHGLIGALLSTLYSQGTAVVPPKFSASKFWTEYIASGSTWFSCVPTILQTMLRVPFPEPLPKIRFIRSCSSALAPATFEQLEAKFKTPVVEAYAMTEASHQMCSNELPPGKRKAGTVGKPQGVDVAIFGLDSNRLSPGQIGEVCIRGANVTSGYLNNPKANAESIIPGSDYFRTGDQGYFDEDGHLVLTGRIKELINRGGEKISPLELDAIMLSHPAVQEAVAFGIPDEKYGQVVNAAVIVKKGATLTYQDLKDYMAQKVAQFKIPDRVFFVEELPKSSTGKIQRRIIAQVFASNSRL